MATLTVFWTAEDGAGWLAQVATKYNLRLLIFPAFPNHRKPIWRDAPFAARDLRNAAHMYLVRRGDVHAATAKTISDVTEGGWGWCVIRGGGRYQSPFPLLEQTEMI